ncbi:hypothetical protein [Sporosarcina luteola]|uniref:hypothetical protein n=1 Tax=Sporosarcina luteola TaxID=582850 RepID=UPI0020400E53|nr:hypothetical protein [Sporosarcina luteola]MCM3711107.1 hypothetical protein [Sporosarcina luteola]
MADIIPFKTKQQLQKEEAMQVIQEWEAFVKWEESHLKASQKEIEQEISQEEVDWLNKWIETHDE